MPSSLKLAREFGDDLALIMVESQGHTADEAEAFAWKMKWMGTQAMWTTERPFDTGAKGLPNFALLSSEGEVLLMGNPLDMHKQIEETIAAEIAKAKQVPESTPKALKGAWKTFLKGDVGKAIAEAKKVQAAGGADGEAAGGVIAHFVASLTTRLNKAEWMIDNAYLVEAQDAMKEFGKIAKDVSEVAERADSLNARLTAADLAPEIEAAVSFGKLQDKLEVEGLQDKLVKQLEQFVRKNDAAKVAARAKRILELARPS